MLVKRFDKLEFSLSLSTSLPIEMLEPTSKIMPSVNNKHPIIVSSDLAQKPINEPPTPQQNA